MNYFKSLNLVRAAYDHLHTVMIIKELGSLGELKVFDYVLSYNSKLDLKSSEILACMTHLIARIELFYDPECKMLGIYSKDAIQAICSRFVKAYNSFIKTKSHIKSK
jgi:hypothetical protein